MHRHLYTVHPCMHVDMEVMMVDGSTMHVSHAHFLIIISNSTRCFESIHPVRITCVTIMGMIVNEMIVNLKKQRVFCHLRKSPYNFQL